MSTKFRFSHCLAAAAMTLAVAIAPVSVTPTTDAAQAATFGRLPVNDLRLVNYLPARNPWIKMWQNYDHNQVVADFRQIKLLGANAVRITLYPEALGWPTPTVEGLAKLKDMVAIARTYRLFVQFTLFDWVNPYNEINDSLNWMRTILAPFKADNTIALVEVKNEINVYNPQAMKWSRAMLGALPSIMPGVPRTISVAGHQTEADFRQLNNQIPRSLLDVIDVHLYGEPDISEGKLRAAIGIRGNRPVFVGEMGKTTQAVAGMSQACVLTAQAQDFFQKRMLLAENNVTGFGAWFLQDVDPTRATEAQLVGGYLDFGLLDSSGRWKPAGSVVHRMFSPLLSANATLTAIANSGSSAFGQYDGNFDCSASNPPDSRTISGYDTWNAYDPAYAARRGVQAGIGVNGTRGAYIGGTSADPSGRTPSLMQRFKIGKVKSVTVTASAKPVHATGVSRLSIAWFNGSTYLGNASSGQLNNRIASWQRLSLVSAAPAGATNFQLHLMSSLNSGTTYYDSVSVVPTK